MKKIILILIGIFLTTTVYGYDLIGPVEDNKIREYVKREIGYSNDDSAPYGSIGPFEENRIRDIIRYKLGYSSFNSSYERGWIGPVEEDKIEKIIAIELSRHELPKSTEQIIKENTLLKRENNQLREENIKLKKINEQFVDFIRKQMKVLDSFRAILNDLNLL